MIEAEPLIREEVVHFPNFTGKAVDVEEQESGFGMNLLADLEEM